MLLFNFAQVCLMHSMFRSVYSVSLCCSVYCLCVNVYCTTATGCQPNFSSQMYHIVSCHIISNGFRYTVSLLSPRNCNSVIYYFVMSIICTADSTNRNELRVISSYHASVLDRAQELRSYTVIAQTLISYTVRVQDLRSYLVIAQDLRSYALTAQELRSYLVTAQDLRSYAVTAQDLRSYLVTAQ